jgi:hypothetical protein
VADHPCVTENIEGETGKNRMGKQRRPMNVAGNHRRTRRGTSIYLFPARCCPPKSHWQSKHIMFQAIRSCTTYCSYLERRFAGARVILLSFSARPQELRFAAECRRQSLVIPHRRHCINRKKIKARPGHMAVRLRHGTVLRGPHAKWQRCECE